LYTVVQRRVGYDLRYYSYVEVGEEKPVLSDQAD